jgi:hypothetical protein
MMKKRDYYVEHFKLTKEFVTSAKDMDIIGECQILTSAFYPEGRFVKSKIRFIFAESLTSASAMLFKDS